VGANGNNPRLDRIERLIEQGDRASRMAHARHEREMAEIREEGLKTREEGRKAREEARANTRLTREDMRRWAALGVNEARSHRKKIAALEAKSAEYQARTDENLAEITDKLNGLIGYVAGLGRRQ
jgi:hypothetical protein